MSGQTWGCRRLGVRYGATVALEEVTFAVAPGTVAAVVGATVPARPACCRGRDGPAGRGLVRRPSERRLGYVSAGPGVWTDLTVDENLRFSGGAYGLDAAALERRIGALLERTGLAGAAPTGRASSRAACARSGPGHGRRPRAGLLILDEPTTGSTR